ncbi:thymidine phosphorylase [Alphaproteobacteria bacterium KMM 3653]|uniref:thymidine phosphorylase n=1 Tax=Harenicola maris TaxID=2841044 RepID=A0AAP2CVR7_9RHOB|nr:thymidine phosphorylase [Harenicola maris]
MTPKALLEILKRGEVPEAAALEAFGRSAGDAELVSNAQLGAFAMGICRAPLDAQARAALTRGMTASGTSLSWDLSGPVIDKHSTGGVGDVVSLVLAPALAACGGFVPMISGRGLGHTGGTLDKLEAIPGLSIEQDLTSLKRITREIGCAIVAASGDLAPADRRLYAVRDVTGTVGSMDLITSSILSKKLAAGLEALVLDVKVGSGALMTGMEEARALALSLTETANAAGCRTAAIISDMNQPAAPAAGNALEVAEAVMTLTGRSRDRRLGDLTVELGGRLLALSGLAEGGEDGRARMRRALESGAAAERFAAMVVAQGGPPDFVDKWRDRLPAARVQRTIWPERSGAVSAIDTRALGEVVIDLGGGRRQASDRINPAVGLCEIARIGDMVGQDRPLMLIHADSEADADRAEGALAAAFAIAGERPVPAPLVIEGIGPEGAL